MSIAVQRMCGRYQLRNSPEALDEVWSHIDATYARWDVEQRLEIGLPPARWNVSPTQMMPTVTGGEKPQTRMMKFGFVPFYEREKPKPYPLINATSEKGIKGVWSSYVKKSRCLIPATAFYEWQKIDDGKTKIPHCIARSDQRSFAFAGIWSDGDGEKFPAGFMILTTTPNALMTPLHHRMPVVVAPENYRAWLAPGPIEPHVFAALTAPLSWPDMRAYPISTLVNSPKNESPAVAVPASDGTTESNPLGKAAHDGGQNGLGLS